MFRRLGTYIGIILISSCMGVLAVAQVAADNTESAAQKSVAQDLNTEAKQERKPDKQQNSQFNKDKMGSNATAQNTIPKITVTKEMVESYRLFPRDLISITVYDELDLSTEQRIDGAGFAQIPLLGSVKVAGLTSREAEKLLEHEYVSREFLVSPQVSINVLKYAPKEIAVLGQVNMPGTVELPLEASTVDIRMVIARVGGFTSIAKTTAVQVTRLDGAGNETKTILDVDKIMQNIGRQLSPEEIKAYEVRPNDVVFVPERFF